MKLLDSNILIYTSLPEFSHLRELIQSENYVSEISRIEVLGFHKISDEEKMYFNSVFVVMTVIPLNQKIINQAIELKQKRKMSIGDSIIAATALVFNLEIITRNTDDFQFLTDIKIINPLIENV